MMNVCVGFIFSGEGCVKGAPKCVYGYTEQQGVETREWGWVGGGNEVVGRLISNSKMALGRQEPWQISVIIVFMAGLWWMPCTTY